MPEETKTAESADIENVDLSFATTKVVERPFAGEIRVDMKELGNYGPQYHLGVHPLHKSDPDLVWHNWSPIPIQDGAPQPTGEFGEVYEALKKVYGRKVPTVGIGALIGELGMFVLRNYEYYDRRTKTTKKKNKPMIVALGVPTQQDIENALNRQATDSAGTPNAVRVESSNTSLSNADLEVALQVMNGRKPKEYMRGLMTNEDIPLHVREAISGGSAKEALLRAGLAQEADGVLVARTVTESAVA
jgi:hypothetical protein